MKNFTSILIFSALVPVACAVAVAADTSAPAPQVGAAATPAVAIELFVDEPWLSAIREGKKTVEGRAGPRQEFAGWIGQTAKFYSAKQALLVRIIDVHHYATLSEFLTAEGWQNAAPHLSSLQATEKAYLEFYPGDYIRDHGGMNGIMISLQP